MRARTALLRFSTPSRAARAEPLLVTRRSRRSSPSISVEPIHGALPRAFNGSAIKTSHTLDLQLRRRKIPFELCRHHRLSLIGGTRELVDVSTDRRQLSVCGAKFGNAILKEIRPFGDCFTDKPARNPARFFVQGFG